ncbi:hypothetical protein [Pseudomonas turukhanskensis]|uniref:Uncharacterized protein n=1 Tax=Pseudomonas turukhanskensis TaxID=1806536 RepID=A0A9W6NI61_9PSED|nr:hypothetical protein [Pseudomonas turukhanskensis]GLK91600.1 hypothetical protein GCM10017655_46640 [Pseudomonas turukhanskensis]
MKREARMFTLAVEAESDEHLTKLIEMALFELRESQKDAKHFFEEHGSTLRFETEGTMGGYKLDYTFGGAELVVVRNQLVSDGFKLEHRAGTFSTDALYIHKDGKSAKLLNVDTLEIKDHDPKKPLPL